MALDWADAACALENSSRQASSHVHATDSRRWATSPVVACDVRFLARLFLNGVALLVASWFVPGLHIATPLAALVAGVFLGLVNALVRPVLLLLTLPLTLLTLGLFIFVINSACLGLTAYLVNGFSVDGFSSAFLGALVVSVVSWILNGLFVPADKP